MSNALKYRPDIDGLRAIAVLAVVFFHFGLGLGGGYVGVDVFFVISGYLITSLIVRDLQNKSFSMVDFWERRVRRILPALAAMTVATLVAGYFILLPDDFGFLGQSVLAQMLLSSNLLFWKTTGYFGLTADVTPMLHTWSLSVEEQFYLFFPVVVWILYRMGKTRPKVFVFAALVIGFLLSLVLAAVLVVSKPQTAFYLLPTRAWELMVGALVALLPSFEFLKGSKVARGILLLAGVGAVLLPMFLYGPETPFPGLAALPPCIGTGAVIYVGSIGLESHKHLLMRALTWKPLVFVGLISYSLYLWHWPVLVYASYWQTSAPTLLERGLWIALAFVLAVLSWKFVETPFRKRRENSSRRKTLAAGFGVMALLAVVGTFLWRQEGVPSRLPAQAQALVRGIHEQIPLQQHRIRPSDASTDNLLSIGIEGEPPKFLLWGDSHAQMLLPAFEGLAKNRKISGEVFYAFATAPVVGANFNQRFGLNEGAPQVAQTVVDYVKRHRIPLVILIANWAQYQKANPTLLRDSLNATVTQLNQIGARVYVVGDVPLHSETTIKKILKNAIFDTKEPIDVVDMQKHQNANSVLYEVEHQVPKAGFLDLSVLFYDAGSRSYKTIENGNLLYKDSNHITANAARVLVEPYLESELGKIIATENKPDKK